MIRIAQQIVVILLLVSTLMAQNEHLEHNKVYTASDGQTYKYVYGTGDPSNVYLGDRTATSVAVSSTYTLVDYAQSPPLPVPAAERVDCPSNQVYDNILCKCVCVLGFYLDSSNKCVPYKPIDVPCGPRQTYVDGRCICSRGYFLIGSLCDVCPPYTTYDSSTLSCPCINNYVLVDGNCAPRYHPYHPPNPTPQVPNCPLNQVRVSNVCVCSQGFYLIKGVCTQCPFPNSYDPSLGICRTNCPDNQVFDLGTLSCICFQGFYLISGKCGSCQIAYSVYNRYTQTCDCIEGYFLNSGACIPRISPPVYPRPVVPAANKCALNQIYYQQRCICASGFYLISGVCTVCQYGTFFDPTLGYCRIQCSNSLIYNSATSTCDCPQGSNKLNNDNCLVCSGNTTFDSTNQVCGCPTGYRVQNNNCVMGCGVNQVLSNGQCCCIPGTYPINGGCGRCSWNELYDKELGICRIPCDNLRVYSLTVKTCVCKPQYSQMIDGTCTTCQSFSTYNPTTKKCDCNAGYQLSLAQCVPTYNSYQNFNNGQIECKKGYYLINYSCGLCPSHLTYDATYRICRIGCKNNEVYDATIRMCRCLPGFYLVNGGCGQCTQKNQVYNAKNGCCDCIDGFKKASGQGCNGVCQPVCAENEDWLGGRCICKPGFYLINNYCTTCPAGQSYDIYERICRIECGRNQIYDSNINRCVCSQGYYLIQGACSRCQIGEIYDSNTRLCQSSSSSVSCKSATEIYSPITGQCICRAQYVKIRGVCTNCPNGYYYDSFYDNCVCRPGYEERNGFCNPICASDQTFTNGQCRCNNGLPLIYGKCATPSSICPINSSPDRETGACVCNPGFSVINGACSNYQYCGMNGYLSNGQCYCNAGFYWVGSQCRTCSQNANYNGYACECFVGYTRDASGNCVKSNFIPTCYTYERYDSALQACVCIKGTQFLSGTCQKIPDCPVNSYYNGVKCVCMTGLILQGNVCTDAPPQIVCPIGSSLNGVSCTCDAGFFYSSEIKSCTKCSNGQVYDGAKCVTPGSSKPTCSTGYIYNSATNTCDPQGASCGENAAWNGASCLCLKGFNLIQGKCVSCPSGTTFDGKTCVSNKIIIIQDEPQITCGSNEVLVTGKCVCCDGFYKIEGKCYSCPANTTWNGAFCACNTGSSQNWCLGKPYTDKNNSCSCLPGFQLVHGLCTKA